MAFDSLNTTISFIVSNEENFVSSLVFSCFWEFFFNCHQNSTSKTELDSFSCTKFNSQRSKIVTHSSSVDSNSDFYLSQNYCLLVVQEIYLSCVSFKENVCSVSASDQAYHCCLIFHH